MGPVGNRLGQAGRADAAGLDTRGYLQHAPGSAQTNPGR